MPCHEAKFYPGQSRLQAAAQRSTSNESSSGGARHWPVAALIAILVASAEVVSASAQTPTMTPTGPTVDCPTPGQQQFFNPPELVSSDGILKGTVLLTEEDQRLPTSTGGQLTCAPQLVRNFRGENSEGERLPAMPPAQPPNPDLRDPEPGPTLRARVGDLVQLTFVNSIDPNRFDPSFDIEACTQYPMGADDKFPNCLHASSTANIHFHGTHTNPNATGDNVYLQIRPLPRNNQGQMTTTPQQVTAKFDDFFKKCASELQNPLNAWPTKWSDIPASWTEKQKELLVAYQQKYPSQRLWDENQKVLNDSWPIYYIGAFPYCFALPAYVDGGSRDMAQAPGTHWYHAHKHGSTAINVANGMTGAFIIEGKYDDDLNDPDIGYGRYIMKDGSAWSTRSQPILVLNELGTVPNRLVGGGPKGVDLAVNGRIRPRLKMQRGEVQLWRIVNASGRSAAYFMPPQGLEWRQIAQDGVQLTDANYQSSLNKPFYMAPANRVDLLVRAPMTAMSTEIRVQNVMSRSALMASPPTPKPGDKLPGTVLLTVDVTEPSVMRFDPPNPPAEAQMPFLAAAPERPTFLRDITDDELKENNYTGKQLVFDSVKQHTINGIQFGSEHAHLNVLLGAREEWTIKNRAQGIDHPLHIHINPFQVTEFFDPNEKLIDPATGTLIGVMQNDKIAPVDRYVTDLANFTDPRQCYIDPANESTWSVQGARQIIEANSVRSASGPCPSQMPPEAGSVWRDVFAIPSALAVKDTNGNPVLDSKGQPIIIPGYFKMRSRFVDYPGLYVTHCHILIHEDRGMMFSVEVLKTKPSPVRHH